MTSTSEKKIAAEVGLIHAEQISLYKFHRFKKKQQTQLKTKQVKQDMLNQWESMGFPKLHCNDFIIYVCKNKLKTNNVQCNGFIAQVPNLS